MIEIITFKGKQYPLFQSVGKASQFSIPYAAHVCKGEGYDIGCMKKEWSLPGSIAIDPIFNDGFHAFRLPKTGVDYIYSSHCLEHINGWVPAMEYWHSVLKSGGSLFLYLPDYSQEYWRPWNNKKHVNILTPTMINDCMVNLGYKHIFVSGVDLNNSFMAMGEK